MRCTELQTKQEIRSRKVSIPCPRYEKKTVGHTELQNKQEMRSRKVSFPCPRYEKKTVGYTELQNKQEMRSRKVSFPCPRYEKKWSDIPNSKINKKCDGEKLVFLVLDMRRNGLTYRTPK